MESEAQIQRSLAKALEKILSVEELLVEGSTPSPQDLSAKLNEFTMTLQEMHEAGNTAYIPVPLDLLRIVDEGMDPAVYLTRKGEGLNKEQQQHQARSTFLSHIKSKIAKMIDEEASGANDVSLNMDIST